MSFKARLDVYRSDADGNVVPIDLQLARSIASDLVDRNPDGSVPECHPATLGYFDGEPAYVDRRGILVVNIGYQDTARLFAALCRLVKKLHVEVWLGDSDDCWTSRVCA